MPIIQMIDAGESIPFDISTTRTIKFDHTDLDSVEEAKDSIIRQIKYIESDSYISDSPVSTSVKLSSFMESANPVEYEIGRVFDEIAEIRQTFSKHRYLSGTISELFTQTYFNRLMDNYRFRKLDDIKYNVDGVIQSIDALIKKELKVMNAIEPSLGTKIKSLKSQLLALSNRLGKTIHF